MIEKAKRENTAKWYARECWPYASDKQIITQYAHWVAEVDWQLICTLTFAWRVSDEQADKTFVEFVKRLERAHQCNVGYVRGDEKRLSGCGKPACGRHFHALFASEKPLDPSVVEVLWKSMAGNRSDDAGAQVRPYDAAQYGACYVLKAINDPYGNWDTRKLHLFHPEARSLQTPNAQMRRTLRRHKARTLVAPVSS